MSKRHLFRIAASLGPQRDVQRLAVKPVRAVQRDGGIASPPAPPAPAIASLINRDPVYPGPQIRVAAKVCDVLKGAQKRFLCQVACFFTVFRQPMKQPVNLTGSLSYQGLERRRFAPLQSFNELNFSRRTRFGLGWQSNLLQIHLPAEGYRLSVAHWLPPGARGVIAPNPCLFPDSPRFRHRPGTICSRSILTFD